jgi:hypothetical protein
MKYDDINRSDDIFNAPFQMVAALSTLAFTEEDK